jgi:hypothetical protein
VETKLVGDGRGVKLQVTLGRAFIMGFGFGLGLMAVGVTVGWIVALLMAAAVSGG